MPQISHSQLSSVQETILGARTVGNLTAHESVFGPGHYMPPSAAGPINYTSAEQPQLDIAMDDLRFWLAPLSGQVAELRIVQ